MQKTFQVGAKTFILDQAKAEAAFAAKKVINGRVTMTFNLLPLKYQWAYDLYRKMKANHWEPEDVPMGKDIEQWRDEKVVSGVERWIIRMGIGYFSAAEGITATVDGKPAKFLRLGTGKECLSCGTCVPWFCPACQDEVCNWFETEADKHRTCGTPKPKPVLVSFPALNQGEPVLTCQVELEKP